jgi:hypothetical protein
MKIEIKKGVVVCGDATKAGDIVDAPDSVSNMLIQKGKAVAYVEPEKPNAEPNPAEPKANQSKEKAK